MAKDIQQNRSEARVGKVDWVGRQKNRKAKGWDDAGVGVGLKGEGSEVGRLGKWAGG